MTVKSTRQGSAIKCFFDFEMTGLHQQTTPISLGIVTNTYDYFYCEFTDYDKSQVDDWIRDNVIKHLMLDGDHETEFARKIGMYTLVRGNKRKVREELLTWLSQFKQVEFIGDCLWYDGILLNNILGGALSLPKNVDYIFKDIATMFSLLGIDPDISREHFIDEPVAGHKHNALRDAKEIQACYEKLMSNIKEYLGNMV